MLCSHSLLPDPQRPWNSNVTATVTVNAKSPAASRRRQTGESRHFGASKSPIPRDVLFSLSGSTLGKHHSQGLPLFDPVQQSFTKENCPKKGLLKTIFNMATAWALRLVRYNKRLTKKQKKVSEDQPGKFLVYMRLQKCPGASIKRIRPLQYSWAPLAAQTVKNPPARWESWFNPWVGKTPWRGHGNSLQHSCAGNPYGQRSLADYSPWCRRVRHARGTKCNSSALRGPPRWQSSKNSPANSGGIREAGLIPGSGRSPGEGNGKPLQHSCLENPMDRGAWQAIVHRVAESPAQPKWLNAHMGL